MRPNPRPLPDAGRGGRLIEVSLFLMRPGTPRFAPLPDTGRGRGLGLPTRNGGNAFQDTTAYTVPGTKGVPVPLPVAVTIRPATLADYDALSVIANARA